MRTQHCFEGIELDTKPSQFDLSVRAAEYLQRNGRENEGRDQCSLDQAAHLAFPIFQPTLTKNCP